MRSTLRSTFWNYLSTAVRNAIAPVDKHHQLSGGTDASKLDKTTSEIVWLPSMYEVYGMVGTDANESEALTTVGGHAPFQYMAYQRGGTGTTNAYAIKAYNGSANYWWLRSASRSHVTSFCSVNPYGTRGYTNVANRTFGAVPCFCL